MSISISSLSNESSRRVPTCETGGSFVTLVLINKEKRMSGYHPDWVGALTAGIGIGISILIGTRIWPQQDRKRVIFIAVVVGVALALVARTLMRRFGI